MLRRSAALRLILILSFCHVALAQHTATHTPAGDMINAIAGGTTRSISTLNIGPEGGAFLSLVADSQNRGTLYAGSNNGGVFKTTDGGANWSYTEDRNFEKGRSNGRSAECRSLSVMSIGGRPPGRAPGGFKAGFLQIGHGHPDQ